MSEIRESQIDHTFLTDADTALQRIRAVISASTATNQGLCLVADYFRPLPFPEGHLYILTDSFLREVTQKSFTKTTYLTFIQLELQTDLSAIRLDHLFFNSGVNELLIDQFPQTTNAIKLLLLIEASKVRLRPDNVLGRLQAAAYRSHPGSSYY